MRKLAGLFLALVLLAQTALCVDVGYSDEYPEGMSEAAIIFVENFWVFKADYAEGVFAGDAERFVRSVDEIEALRDAMNASDLIFDEVMDAVTQFKAYRVKANIVELALRVLRGPVVSKGDAEPRFFLPGPCIQPMFALNHACALS